MRVLALLLVTALVIGCGASPGATAGPTSTPRPLPETPEELGRFFCPPSDLDACLADVLAAAEAGQPAALCTGPQSDRWNIVVPKPGDGIGSPCAPEGKGTIQGIIVAP